MYSWVQIPSPAYIPIDKDLNNEGIFIFYILGGNKNETIFNTVYCFLSILNYSLEKISVILGTEKEKEDRRL